MILFPELVGDFEEKILMFDISKFNLYDMMQRVIDIFHENPEILSKELLEQLKLVGFDDKLSSLWEIGMLKSQNPRINDIKRQIDCLMIAVQIKELNKDINEYKIKLENNMADDEDYQHYLNLKAERDMLIQESDKD